jgi:hypothetical protein
MKEWKSFTDDHKRQPFPSKEQTEAMQLKELQKQKILAAPPAHAPAPAPAPEPEPEPAPQPAQPELPEMSFDEIQAGLENAETDGEFEWFETCYLERQHLLTRQQKLTIARILTDREKNEAPAH